MQESDSRGRAYQCKLCDSKGDKVYGLTHVAKIHVDPPPFCCIPCDFCSPMLAEVNHHTEKSRHRYKMEKFWREPVRVQCGGKLGGLPRATQQERQWEILQATEAAV